MADVFKPSTWMKYKESLCEGCKAHCCKLPVEVTTDDLIRMGYLTPDQARAPKKALRLLKGIVRAYREKTLLFMLEQRPNDDCIFLGEDRRCTIYEKRPAVCRAFPSIGPRPGYCPEERKSTDGRNG